MKKYTTLTVLPMKFIPHLQLLTHEVDQSGHRYLPDVGVEVDQGF